MFILNQLLVDTTTNVTQAGERSEIQYMRRMTKRDRQADHLFDFHQYYSYKYSRSILIFLVIQNLFFINFFPKKD